MRPDSRSATFGEVWLVEVFDRKEPRLIVSSDFYHHASPDNVLTARVDAPASPAYSPSFIVEEVPEVGTAQLDQITVIHRRRLIDWVAVLSEDRRRHISGLLKDLVGKTS